MVSFSNNVSLVVLRRQLEHMSRCSTQTHGWKLVAELKTLIWWSIAKLIDLHSLHTVALSWRLPLPPSWLLRIQNLFPKEMEKCQCLNFCYNCDKCYFKGAQMERTKFIPNGCISTGPLRRQSCERYPWSKLGRHWSSHRWWNPLASSLWGTPSFSPCLIRFLKTPNLEIG